MEIFSKKQPASETAVPQVQAQPEQVKEKPKMHFDPGRPKDLEKLIEYLEGHATMLDPMQKSFIQGARGSIAFLSTRQISALFDLLHMVEEGEYRPNNWQEIYQKRL